MDVEFARLVTLQQSVIEDDGARQGRDGTCVLAGADLGLSTLVLGELYVEATRATRRDALTHYQAERLVRSLGRSRSGT